MISFRYHVVTIVAVFLALALGLLAGSAFVQPRLVDQLKRQTQSQLRTIHDQQSEIDGLRSDLGHLKGFTDNALVWLTKDRLLGTPIVILTQEGVPDGVVGEAQRSLSDAGADVIATLSARSKLVSEDPADVQQLAQIAGQPEAVTQDVPEIAARALAERLSQGRRGSISEDVLHGLLAAGFLTAVGSQVSDATLNQIGGAGQAVVIVSGGPQTDPVVPPAQFAVPLAEELGRLAVPVAAGQASDTAFSFVELLRADGGQEMVTVDDLDLSMGGAALVLGLEQLIVSGQGGAYGIGDGTELLPPIPS